MDYIQTDHPAEAAPMRYSTQVKSISYLKANAAEMLQQLAELREPVLITQNGEAKAVLQDVASYEEMQETLALLKLLALGDHEVDAGLVQPIAEAVAGLRAELRDEFKR
jgi:prevent-host-death family protein